MLVVNVYENRKKEIKMKFRVSYMPFKNGNLDFFFSWEGVKILCLLRMEKQINPSFIGNIQGQLHALNIKVMSS